MKTGQFCKLISLNILLIILSACSTTSNNGVGERYFSLTPLNQTYLGKALSDQLVLGIGPVEILRSLNRPQLIYRKNNNEILFSERNQWAGSLREEIQKVLVDRIIDVSGSNRIMHYPWLHDLKPEYEVRIRIERLDGILGENAVLEAHWDLLTSKGKELLASRESRFEIEINKGDDFLDYVIAQQTALTKLADEILDTVISNQK